MNTGDTTEEEIAELVFKSDDSELNDMMLTAKKYNYEIPHLIWKITIEINTYFGDQLQYVDPDDRNSFLINKIKSEMNYYAHWWEREKRE
jgi:hypothetical protein